MPSMDLEKLLEDAGVKQDKIDQILAVMKLSKKEKAKKVSTIKDQIIAVKLAMRLEKDWKKKAELAAWVISLESEE